MRDVAILNALPAQVALLDSDGLIVSVNPDWSNFAREMGLIDAQQVIDTSYFDVCAALMRAEPDGARLAEAGIRSVIAGEIRNYIQQFSCDSPTESRQFQLVVTPVAGVGPADVVVMHLDISSQQRAEDESRELQNRFAELLMNMDLASVILDKDGRITFCNDHLLQLTGWSHEETIGNDWFEQFIPPDEAGVRRTFDLLLSGSGASRMSKYVNRIVTRTGDLLWMRWANTVQRSPSGQVIGTASIGEDITRQRQADKQLQHLHRVRMVLSGINTLIVRVADHDTLYRGACRIAVEDGGFLMAMLVVVDPGSGRMSVAATAGKDEGLVENVNKVLATPASNNSMTAQVIREKRMMVSNDCRTDDRLTLREDYDARGVQSLAVLPLLVAEQAVGAFVLYSTELDFFGNDELELLTELTDDIAFAIDHIEKSARLAYLTYYDPLTELPNAQLFQTQLDRYIAAADEDGDKVCVLVLDLDGFTDINRTMGRQVGDALLCAVADRLQGELTEPFSLARTAADTFAVATPSRHEAVLDCDQVRNSAQRALQQPFMIFDQEISVSGRAGIAVFPEDGNNGKSVLLNAELALKQAKISNQRYVYSSPSLNELATSRLTLAGELRKAVDENQLRIYYQPKVDMTRGDVVGAEALVRWQHPDLGLLAPAEFMGLADETGIIVQIGAWMLRAVCAQQAAWVAAGLPTSPVAVNVSAVQFEQGDLLEVIRDALQASSLAPALLHIELTESAVMRDPDAAAELLRAVRALGVELAIDDFGTGYSSLASLKRYPFSSVKIDRSFVSNITTDTDDAAIASTVIAMAHRLRMRVVAEGVESQGQFNYLRAQGCDEMQGYLFSPPIPAEDYEQMRRSGARLSLPESTDEDRQTLLVVDDEAGIRSALTRLLRQDGYRILSAGTGEDALQLLSLNAVQVIISDQRMPGMSGSEFLGKVAQLYPDTVRILLSGYTDLKVVTDGVNQGAVYKFITKPWDDDRLRRQVRDAFAHHRPSAGTAA